MPPLRRYGLTDAQWKIIQRPLPKQGRGGRWNDHRTTLDGMLWVLRCGPPCSDTPNEEMPR
jgi:transposase